MTNKITIGIKGNIRIYVANTTELVETAREKHNLLPVASIALGRTLTATAMMGAMLKSDQNIVVIINGGGPLGTIMAESDAEGNVRGYVGDPTVHVTSNHTGKLAVGYAVGTSGSMQVIKDLNLREPFTGNTQMVDGEISKEFTYYFATSEQTPSAVSLGVIVDEQNVVTGAGGIIIQLLPGHGEADIEEVEAILPKIEHFTKYIEDKKTGEEIINDLFAGVKILETKTAKFNCKCSKEKMTAAILALGKADIVSMIEKNEDVEITCRYCSKTTKFTPQDLQEIKNKLDN